MLSDDGSLIGVNTFKNPGEALNFAVALRDVKAFLEAKSPHDPKEPFACFMDTNADGKVDVWNYDVDRDDKWDYSLHDTDYDGKPEVEGVHADGNLIATAYKPYKAGKSPRPKGKRK